MRQRLDCDGLFASDVAIIALLAISILFQPAGSVYTTVESRSIATSPQFAVEPSDAWHTQIVTLNCSSDDESVRIAWFDANTDDEIDAVADDDSSYVFKANSISIKNSLKSREISYSFYCTATLPSVGAVRSRTARVRFPEKIRKDPLVVPSGNSLYLPPCYENQWTLNYDESRMHPLPNQSWLIENVTRDTFQLFPRCGTRQKVNITVINQGHSSKVDFLTKPNNVLIEAGSSAILPCIGSGSPTPWTVWRHNLNVSKAVDRWKIRRQKISQLPVQYGGILFFSAARVDDSGNYTCVVKNGKSKKKTKTVLVKIVDIPQVETTFLNVTGVEDKAIRLTCPFRHFSYSSSFPRTEQMWIVWLFNNTPINETLNKYQIENDTLVISQASVSDEGMYQCLVKTPLRSVQTSFRVRVADRPNPPVSLTVHRNCNKFEIRWRKSLYSGCAFQSSYSDCRLISYVLIAANSSGSSIVLQNSTQTTYSLRVTELTDLLDWQHPITIQVMVWNGRLRSRPVSKNISLTPFLRTRPKQVNATWFDGGFHLSWRIKESCPTVYTISYCQTNGKNKKVSKRRCFTAKTLSSDSRVKTSISDKRLKIEALYRIRVKTKWSKVWSREISFQNGLVPSIHFSSFMVNDNDGGQQIAFLNCTATGYPTPNISLIPQGNVVGQCYRDGLVRRCGYIVRRDAVGQYTCVAENELGQKNASVLLKWTFRNRSQPTEATTSMQLSSGAPPLVQLPSNTPSVEFSSNIPSVEFSSNTPSVEFSSGTPSVESSTSLPEQETASLTVTSILAVVFGTALVFLILLLLLIGVVIRHKHLRHRAPLEHNSTSGACTSLHQGCFSAVCHKTDKIRSKSTVTPYDSKESQTQRGQGDFSGLQGSYRKHNSDDDPIIDQVENQASIRPDTNTLPTPWTPANGRKKQKPKTKEAEEKEDDDDDNFNDTKIRQLTAEDVERVANRRHGVIHRPLPAVPLEDDASPVDDYTLPLSSESGSSSFCSLSGMDSTSEPDLGRQCRRQGNGGGDYVPVSVSAGADANNESSSGSYVYCMDNNCVEMKIEIPINCDSDERECESD